MFMELQFEDIIFGIFPLVGAEMSYLSGYWANNSVGDIIDILSQMLEVSVTSAWDISLDFYLFILRHSNLSMTWMLLIVYIFYLFCSSLV